MLKCDDARKILRWDFQKYLRSRGTALQVIPDYTPELQRTVQVNISIENLFAGSTKRTLHGFGLHLNPAHVTFQF
jgi:hypothetical protein